MNNGVELEVGIKFLGREIILTEKAVCDDHTLDLYHTAILNTCDRCEEVGKTIGLVTKVIQGLNGSFTHYLQSLTSAVNRMIPKFGSRQLINQALAFEDANSL